MRQHLTLDKTQPRASCACAVVCAAGKYTVGLGQQAMTFCGDREDVVSMAAATAVLHVMANSGITPADIGR
jgi:3-hydroxy-3-methylglutaryl CoA synthase